MKKLLLHIAIALLTGGVCASAAVIDVTGSTTDNYIGLNSSLQPTAVDASAANILVGDDSYTYGKGDCAAILVFQLPDLGGLAIETANLSVFWEIDWAAGVGGHTGSTDTSVPKWCDLYALRTASSGTVLTNDYGYKTTLGANDTLIQSQFLYAAANTTMDPTLAETDVVADSSLAAWLTAQYAGGAQPGDYVFLRVHGQFDTGNPFTISSANSASPPMLTIVLEDLIPTAAFTASKTAGSAPLLVTFEDISTGQITNRFWDFGDGTSTNTALTSLQHTYTAAGTYTASLTINGPYGTDSETVQLTATNLPPLGTVEISGNSADQTIGIDSTGGFYLDWVAQPTVQCADDHFRYGRGESAAILVFELPDIGTQTVQVARLSVTFEADYIQAGATTNDSILPKTAALYGIRYAASSTVLTNDYGFKTDAAGSTLIQPDFLTQPLSENQNPTPIGTGTGGKAALAAWMQAQYAAGARGGDFVFLRIHANVDSYSPFIISSADSTNPPVLTLTFNDSGEAPPAPVATLGGGNASFGSGQDVINWSTTQGFGYIYSIWFSTNLLNGFQPLETNLPDSVQSWTNLIDSPSVFYKIEVQ